MAEFPHLPGLEGYKILSVEDGERAVVTARIMPARRANVAEATYEFALVRKQFGRRKGAWVVDVVKVLE